MVARRFGAPFTPAMIAQICHAANCELQHITGEAVADDWELIGDDMQQTVIHGVKVAQEGNGPEELHRQWVMIKEAQGWVRGDTKDAEAKTHPNLVPYEQLGDDQKAKDQLFMNIVRALSDPEQETINK